MALARIMALGILLTTLFGAPAHALPEGAWRAVPARVPADSLAVVLRGMEARNTPGVRPGEAAYALAQFHYARGEYRAAADAYLRAGARLGGADRMACRYGYGLSLLAAGSPAAARGVLDEVGHSGGPLGALGLLATAQAWEAEGRPERAFDALRWLLASRPGEAGPAALERFAALAPRFHREADGHAASARLLREYPASVEAARALAVPAAVRGGGPVAVRLGVFADHARAEALLKSALLGGFSDARVERHAGAAGKPTTWEVVLGSYATRDLARRAAGEASRKLGVSAQIQAP